MKDRTGIMRRRLAVLALSAAACGSIVSPALAQSHECKVRPVESGASPLTDPPQTLRGASLTLVFEDDFDGQANWSAESTPIGGCPSGAQPECATMPDGWDYYYSSEKWTPSSTGDDSIRPSARVSSDQGRGASGKSFIVYDESWGSPSGWGSDAILAKDLGEFHDELYFEFWIKFESGYRWHSLEDPQGGQNGAKLARLTTYDGPAGNSRFFFSPSGGTTPLVIMGLNPWKEVTSGGANEYALYSSTVRCSPSESNYKCANFPSAPIPFLPGRPMFENSFGDGGWHKVGMHVKRNSAPGVADGFLHQYFDGELTRSLDGIPFVGAGGDISKTFNIFMLGGNMHNYPAPESDRLEQWTAFDDVRVYAVD